jgi:putative two-component system response regulator
MRRSEEAAMGTEPAKAERRARSGSTILVTDDEPGIRQALGLFLGRLGHEVVEAPTADAALELLAHQRFDLVLSDIALPGAATGLDLLTHVKQRAPDVDVILMTGHMDVDFAVNAIKRGVSDFFKKPFLFEELEQSVARCLDRRRRLDRTRELEQLAARHETLKGVQRELLVTLAALLDGRHPHSRRHGERVGALARSFAAALGLPAREQKLAALGGRLHDIGKLALPDALLQKAAPLDATERVLMQRHAALGAELLEPITVLRPFVPVIRSHHENWDGSGTPDALSGEAIPPAARIVRLADAWDALTSPRPWRAADSIEEAAAAIAAGRGKAFAPDLVAPFLAHVKDMAERSTADEAAPEQELDACESVSG